MYNSHCNNKISFVIGDNYSLDIGSVMADLDVLNKDEFKVVNVSLDNYQLSSGISLDILKKIIKRLISLNVCTIDLVEYNPLLDKDKSCYNKIDILLDIVRGGINDIS